MSDGKLFPDLFFSKASLKHNVNVIKIGEGKKQEKYCILSIQNENDSNFEQNLKTTYYNNAELAPYYDNEFEMIDCGDLEESYEINPTKSGKYLTSFYLPTALHSVIIGPRGSKLRELQDNTRTLIKVPKINEENDLIKITGLNERSVASARTQIALLTLAKREKMAITHFVSIPMFSEEIQNSFHKFKNNILNGPPTRGIDETIFQNPEKFHLTIVTLTLLDQQEIDSARNVLNTTVYDCIRKFFKSDRNNLICMQGIEIMNDDPSEVNVLYGKVNLKNSDDNRRLQVLADEIVDCFYRQGLVKKQYDNVKLHVTLMNSLFRRKVDDYEKIEGKNDQKRESFDATYILEKYKNFYFGATTFSDIHLSIRFTTKNGYYDSEITIKV